MTMVVDLFFCAFSVTLIVEKKRVLCLEKQSSHRNVCFEQFIALVFVLLRKSFLYPLAGFFPVPERWGGGSILVEL